MEDWAIVKIIGKGSYGVVCLAKQITDQTDVPDYHFAIKLVPTRDFSSLLWEEQLLEQFKDCPEIVRCLGSELSPKTEDCPEDIDFYCLKLEYAAGGTLNDLIKQRTKLPEDEIKDYLRMILRGLSCMHSKGFVHIDLKPSNILVFPQSDDKMKLKIIDFGLSERCNHMDFQYKERNRISKFKGTPKYMSPESIVFSEVDGSHDIWSLGCILVKMVSGKSVWDDCTSNEQLMTELFHGRKIPTIPDELSEQGKDFIEKCFIRSYMNRWTADMLLQHPYLNEDTASEEGSEDN